MIALLVDWFWTIAANTEDGTAPFNAATSLIYFIAERI